MGRVLALAGREIKRSPISPANQELLWRKLFKDPSLWWDNRFHKKTQLYSPDFVHSMTKEALWIDRSSNFAWVEAKLATLRQPEVHSGEGIRAQYLLNSGVEPGGLIDNSSRVVNCGRTFGSVTDLSKPCEVGRLDEALQEVELLHRQGNSLSREIVYSLLHRCTKKEDLEAGRRVHSLMVSSGFDSIAVLGDHLIRLFASCGSLQEANQVFCKVAKPSVYTWAAIISAHAKLGRGEMAFDLYQKMQLSNVKSNKYVYLAVLKACTSTAAFTQGRLIHAQIIKSGLESDVVIGNTLIDMYAKCGSLKEACKVFDNLPNRNVVSWGVVIAGYAQHGHGLIALELFQKMQQEGIKPDKVTFSSILKACGSIGAIKQGRLIHDQIINSGLELDVVVGSALVDMYAKSGSLEEARRLFDKLPNRGVVSWGTMIAGYAQHGHGLPALELFEKMQQKGINPDKVAFLGILKACGSIGSTKQGRLIHDQIIKSGLELDVVIGSTLVDMYSKCGSLEEARKVFDKLPNRDVVTWGAMIAGYAQHGHGRPALDLFEKMQHEGIKPNKVTFLSILKACGSIKATEQGRRIHDQIIKIGLESDVVIGSSLVDMYAKCGILEESRNMFDKLPNRDVVSWGTMIAGYAQHGHGLPALELFEKMQQEGIIPHKATYLSILKACGSIGATEQGRLIHDQIIESGLELDVVIGSSLVDMYANCGSLEEARKVFDKLPNRDVVLWGAMIAGYVQHGHGLPALELFAKMQEEGILPRKATFLSILKACGSIGATEQGRMIHDQIIKTGLELDVVIGSTLVDMYAKCGSLEEARKVFDKLPDRNVVSWGAMIGGYAQCGNYVLAMQCLEDMQQQGLKPNDVIFVNILATCCHVGLLDKGCQYFKSMTEEHGITPNIEHYNCMVDLFGRAGCLNEAEDLLQTMPIPPDIIGWTSLLTACRTYGNVELGRRCFEQIVRMDPSEAAGYVLMSNIYADAHMWEDVDKIQELKKCAGAWKKPGRAWIEVDGKVHEFVVGDKSHHQSDAIYAKLKSLSRLIKEEGYVPQLDLVLQPMLDEDKEDALCGHCEKLAIAFGLVSTPGGTTIRATKNLRVCVDCHNGTKIISKIERREIVIRDVYRIHHFKDGACSCGDYY